jgi:hypothetical protein
MSLQIALQQIQTPSFWGANTTGQSKYIQTQNRDRRKDNDSRRAEIMKILRVTGKPMDYATLSELTGWTFFSLRNLINTLEKDGQVLRSKTYGRDSKSLVEAI